jgi:hypothetical protein
MIPLSRKAAMVLLIVGTLTFSACSSSGSKTKNTSGLYLVLFGGKYGYIDKKGQLVITPQFDVAMDFTEGLASVRPTRGPGTKVGFIDKTGQFVISPQFDMAWPFSEGLSLVTVGDKDGYIDKAGKMVIIPQFVQAMGFHDGLASARIGGIRTSSAGQQWGFIDKTGGWVVNPSFNFVNDMSDGRSYVYNPNGTSQCYISKEAYAAKKDNAAYNPGCLNGSPFNAGGAFSEGYAPVQFYDPKGNSKWGYIDHGGVNATTPYLDMAFSFSEGLARVRIGDKYGYIDQSGFHELGAGGGGNMERMRKTVIPPQFENAHDFSEGLAAVRAGGKWGYIDKTGKMVINPQFDDAGEFSGDLAAVTVAGKRGYIDKDGKYVWNPSN